ncbi:MAG: T9SS type A sorting domain-containing protein [Bacteroidota bacterium]
MKHFAAVVMFLVLKMGVIGQKNEHFSLAANCFEAKEITTAPSLLSTQHQNIQGSAIACTANTFWTINSLHVIEEFQLNGNTITTNGIINSNSQGTALAYCNNLNGGAFSPTFYTCNLNYTAAYFDGTNWITAPGTSDSILINAGGNGNYLYYHGAAGFIETVQRYTGAGFSMVYTDSVRYIVADIAVDDSGNVWLFRGNYPIANFLDVISPAGQLLKRYNVNANFLNSYGNMLLNGVLYVGIGMNNLVHPNTLMPFTITPDSAIMGTPINMPPAPYFDLASCYAGAPLTGCSFPSPSLLCQDTLICIGNSTQICAPTGFASYSWNFGQNSSCINAQLAGNYYVTVTDNTGCTAESNRIAITVYPLPPVGISVNGDTLSVYDAVTQQWYLNGSAIFGATSSTHVASQGGSYTVAVTDTNGCVAVSSPVLITDIDNVSEQDMVSVFRLTVDSWQLTVGSSWLGGVVELFDASGKVVFKSEIQNPTSEISPDVAKGIYLLHISSGKASVVRKLVSL